MSNYTQAQLRNLETIGCDLGDRMSELFVIKPNEDTHRPKAIQTTREGFLGFFKGRPQAHVVLEVGTHSRWVSATLEGLGHVVTVANPRNVELITKSNHKNDKKDARLLAKLGRADVDLLSPVKHRGEQVQAELALVKVRDALVRSRSKLVCQSRGLVKSFGFRLAKCDAERFHRVTRESIPESLKPALEPAYEVLEVLEKQIAALDRKIEQVAERYPEVAVIAQPKGVGVLSALTFLLSLEDPRRFASSRQVGPFLGLCPKQRMSGKSDPDLRISKAGDPLLRRLLVQCAHYVLGPFGEDSDLRRWGLGLCARGGKNAKKRSRVAVARKLAVLMHRLWITGEVYQPLGYHAKNQDRGTPTVETK